MAEEKTMIIKEFMDNLIFKKCKIEPLNSIEGTIISTCVDSKGFKLQVRYFIDKESKQDWFYDFEILI